MIKNYFKIAFRSLAKTGLSGILNIVGLAVSLVLVILIGLWVQNENRYDNYHPRVNQKYLVKNTYQYDNGNSKTEIYSPYNAVSHLQLDYPEVENVAYCGRRHQPLKITVGNQQFSEEGRLYVSKNWFDFFHYDAIQVDTGSFNNQRHSVILTENRAKRYFGHTTVIGKTISIDSIDYAVQGVVRDNPSNSSLDFDVLLPFDDQLHLNEANQWMYFNSIIFVETKPSTNTLHLQQKIDRLFSENIQWTQSGISNRTTLLPLRKLHFDDSLPQLPFSPTNYQYVIIFSILAIFLLVAAVINFVNLTLAQAFSRVRELGTRRIVGAGRSQLFIQLLLESAFNCTIALIAALLIAHIILPYFNAYFSLKLTIDFGALHVHTFFVGLWLVLVLLSGVYPALHLSSIRAMHLFKGMGTLRFGGKKVRKALLVTQLSVAVIMMISVLTMYLQASHIRLKSNTIDHSQTFMVTIPPIAFDPNIDIRTNQQREAMVKKNLKDQLLQSPRIKQVSTTINRSVINGDYLMVGSLDWDGKPQTFQAQYGNWPVDDDFDKVMNLEVKHGRWFLAGDSTDQHSFILNETAVSQFNIREPVIGTRLNNNGREGIVIGVVSDFHFQNLREPIRPMVFYKRNNWGYHFLVKGDTESAHLALRDAESIIKTRFPNGVFTYRFLDEEFNMVYRKDLQTMTIASTISLISICLSFVGLLGMITFECKQRTKEIGIRKVLGASVAGIVQLLSKDFVKLVFIAIVIASPIAWWAMNNWLEDFAYRIDIEWWMFALAGLVAVVIALLTVSWQAIRAAVANPVESLRDE